MLKMNKQQKLLEFYPCCRCGQTVLTSKLDGLDVMGISLGEVKTFDTDKLYCSDFSMCASQEAKDQLDQGKRILETIDDLSGADSYLMMIDNFVISHIEMSSPDHEIQKWALAVLNENGASVVKARMADVFND
jgi:hypothetical protein